MSFAERQQRLQRFFTETGLQGWGDANHPQDVDKLIFDVTKILFVLKKMKEKIDNNPDINRWKDAILDLRRSQQRIEEKKYIRWIVRVYQDYLYRIYDIKYIHRVLVDTIQRLGPFLSVPEGTEQRHLTIQTILMSLELIEEILQPVRDFVDLRESDGLIRTNFRYFMQAPWSYQYHDDLSVTQLFDATTMNQQDLEQVFIDEHLLGWGTQGQVDEENLQYMERLHQAIKDVFDPLRNDRRFKDWWRIMDIFRRQPDYLQSAYQLSQIWEGYWRFQEPFHRLRYYWSPFLKVIVMCAPYLSQPIYGFDLQLLRILQKALRIVGMYRIIAQPFIMVIKGLPYIVTGELPAIDGPPIAQAEIPGAGPSGGSPPRSGPIGAPPPGSPYRAGHFAGSPSSAGTSGGSPYTQGYFGPHSKQ